ncbi:MAG: methylmalonyl-CoA mutase [Candidatus Methanolliviera sp. GoM_oil]|nr:MAG: methylmalonyl-CoA mutase [Candidatus Methanolliviera sp. GoM_oil]
MSEEKTTKEIFEEKLKEKKRIPLYNPDAIEKIKEGFDEWKNTKVREKDRENWEVTPYTILGSEIPRGMLYTPCDVADLDYEADVGFPGQEPFTRGPYPNMYRGRVFTIRQLSGAGSPEETNERLKFLLESGATGTNLALDLPTVQMFDSDEPESVGQVGTVGVPIDCVQDMEVIYKDIPIDKVSSSIVTHYPRNSMIIFPMFLVMAEKRGYDWKTLPGSVQNDITMENIVRRAPEYIPPADDFRIQCDNIEFLRKEVPRWNYITLNGYNLREEGTDEIMEMAVAFANGIAILEEMQERGYDPDWVAERMAFFWSVSNDFFEEIARLRAARRLWYKIMKYRFDSKKPRSQLERCHIQTSGISLQRVEPYDNVIRSAFQAMAAILGGTQSLHVDSYAEAYSVPLEEDSLLALRTQQIINAETQVTQVVDPLAGSFYVEKLTNIAESKVLDQLEEIEKEGGFVKAIESGWMHNKIASYIAKERRKIDDGTIKIVGYNYFRRPDVKEPPIKCQEVLEERRQRQIEKLKKWREERDNDKVESCLGAIVDACKSGENVTYKTIEAARAGATEGEMRRKFVEAFGMWKQPLVI